MTANAADDTQAFIELIERNGFKWILEHAASACRVEVDTGGGDAVRRIERLTTLAEHLSDVAAEEA